VRRHYRLDVPISKQPGIAQEGDHIGIAADEPSAQRFIEDDRRLREEPAVERSGILERPGLKEVR
jgi:hypothetical protein